MEDILAYKKAKEMTKEFGTSYYFATRLFPKNLRYATYALYAFFRIPDEIVDNPGSKEQEEVIQALDSWHKKWVQEYQGFDSQDEILRICAQTFHNFQIPFEYSEDFLRAMKQDLTKNRYDTYAELEQYMYGSAVVVGLMMCYVIGFNDRKALVYAKKLGYAMQLTNFLRDIREDYEKRDRIYIPLDELASFELSPRDIEHHIVNENFMLCMKFQIERARKLYAYARNGVKYLSPDGRLAVNVAISLYSAILDKIEEQQYDVYQKRARTSRREKLYLVSREVIKKGKG